MGERKLDRVIDPKSAILFKPKTLSKFKDVLFERVGAAVGGIIHGNVRELAALPDDIIPIVGCMFECVPLIKQWRATGRTWIYWDRGYARRIFATWLPRGERGGYYRWHVNGFQMSHIRDVPSDRWKHLDTTLEPWRKGGSYVVLAVPSIHYLRFHGQLNWLDRTYSKLKKHTDRKIIIREKTSPIPLSDHLLKAHALVTHGSNVGTEAAILGCPVIVDASSAAAIVGLTDLSKIENPVYPDRDRWLHSLAYSQFNEHELVDGTLWRLIE